MYWHSQFDQYMQQLNAYLHSQNQQIEQLKQSIEHLRQELVQMKEKTTPSVVRNEYKFDLLKVEKLEGTLNIGLNPNGKDGAIGEMDVTQSVDVPTIEKQHPGFTNRIKQHIHEYLNTGAVQCLMSLETQYGYPLGEEYRKFILDDVSKQIDQRIQHYLKQVPADVQMTQDQLQSVEQNVTQKVIEDINKSCEAFIQNLPKNDGSSPAANL
jgi:spore germination protein PC